MFGDDHVVYSKPVTITEERLQEALIKQQKQKALREALDRQMAEMAERKQGRFGRRRSSKLGLPASPAPGAGAGENGTTSSPVRATSPTTAAGAPASPRSPPARRVSSPGYKPENIRNMVPSDEGAVQRYTLNFEDGQANFVAEPVEQKKPSNPSSQRAKEKDAKGQQEQQRIGANKGKKAMSRVGQRNVNGRAHPSPRGDQRKRGEGEYQTNSLPIQLVEKSPGLPERLGLGASPRVGSGKNGRKYDTQSLPVDAMYQLSEARKNGMPLKARAIPRPSSSSVPGESDTPETDAADEYDHNCLPRNYDLMEDMRQRMGKASPTKNGGAQRQSPTGGRRAPRTTNSRQSGVRGINDARRSNGSPAAGADADEEPAGMQENRSPTHAGRQNVTSREKGRRGQSPGGQQQRAPVELVNQLNKKIESNAEQMRRMREKEKGWEDQVKQLKAELRNARQKEKDLTKLVDAKAGAPLRAETAPDGPASRRVKSPQQKGQQRMQKPTSAVPQSRVGKPDFSRARVFSPEEFHPVSGAPDQTEATYVPDAMPEHFGTSTPLSDRSLEAQPDDPVFGLPQYDTDMMVPIGLEHLLQFADAQIITKQQAERLWTFFLEQPHRSEEQGGEEGERQVAAAEEQPAPASAIVPVDNRNRAPSMVTQEISLSVIPQQLPPTPREYGAAAVAAAAPKVPSPRKRNSVTTEIELDNEDEDDGDDSDEKGDEDEDEDEDASEEETEDEDDEDDASEEEEEEDAADAEDDASEEEDDDEKETTSSSSQLTRKAITPVLTPALRNKITRRHTDELTNVSSKEATPQESPRHKQVSASGSRQGLSPV